MKFDDLIPIIILIIFFVLPGIGRILEAVAGKPKTPSKTSDEVKDYLQKMRNTQKPKPSNQNRTPAAKPGKAATDQNDYYQDRKQKKAAVSAAQAAKKVVQELKEHDHSATELAAMAVDAKKVAVVSKSPARRDVLRTNVMEVGRFTDIQKAIILKEIFGKPKTFGMNLLQKE